MIDLINMDIGVGDKSTYSQIFYEARRQANRRLCLRAFCVILCSTAALDVKKDQRGLRG